MKKSILFFIFIGIILISNCVLGYSNQYIEFDLPKDYSFSSSIDDNGANIYKIVSQSVDNINIVITPYYGEKKIEFTNEYLDKYYEEIKTNLESYLNTSVALIKKDITTVGKEFYKCVMIQYKIEQHNLYQKQYAIISDNYIYTITLSSNDSNYFMNNEILNFLNSIRIKDDITEISTNTLENKNKYVDKLGASTLIIISICIMSIITNKLKKNKQEKKDK